MSAFKTRQLLFAGVLPTALLLGSGPVAQAQSTPSFNLYGSPGLVDMPTAEMAPDAELSTTVSHFAGTTRTTLNFQITPRLSGAFRYSAIDGVGSASSTLYDRSFDLTYQLSEETDTRPAVKIALQDFMGTGVYSGEYIVATKTVAPGFSLTGGLGWGRLGGYNSIGSFGSRPSGTLGKGGIPNYDRWFRGPFAAFAGASYSPNERLTFKLEYSSDPYTREIDGSSPAIFERKSPLNFGVDYRFNNGTQLSAHYLYGSEVGVQFTSHLNPKRPITYGGLEAAPLPVQVRAPGAASDLGWTSDTARSADARTTLQQLLETEGLKLEALELQPQKAVLRVRNPRYGAEPQAVGRAARAMSRALPASVETFVIILSVDGMETSATTLKRRDLEALEHQEAKQIYARAEIADAFSIAPAAEPLSEERFSWSLGPYFAVNIFDPDNPIRADIGAELSAIYRITPSLEIAGSLVQKLGGNLEDTRDVPGSPGLHRVRTDYASYSAEGNPAIKQLTVAKYDRLGPDLYGRVTAGYLEAMYAGLSGELLWKPVDSRLALGVEANYVQQRDFDQLFGLQDYNVLMGQATAYYQFGNGFHGRASVGRYLAGDIGTTLRLDREFANGWSVGAYATFTNVSTDDFGEGSFDKGLHLTIPMSWVLGTASKRSNTIALRSLTRDGGAQLEVPGRLYERVRGSHQPDMQRTWGRFWR